MILLCQSLAKVALSPGLSSDLKAIISLHVMLLYLSHWYGIDARAQWQSKGVEAKPLNDHLRIEMQLMDIIS